MVLRPLHERRSQVAAAVAAEQHDGRIDPALDADALASQILAMFDGLQIQWLLDPQSVDMVAVFENFLARLRPR